MDLNSVEFFLDMNQDSRVLGPRMYEPGCMLLPTAKKTHIISLGKVHSPHRNDDAGSYEASMSVCKTS